MSGALRSKPSLNDVGGMEFVYNVHVCITVNRKMLKCT